MYYLAEATQFAILIIDGMALAIIAIGTVEAFLKRPAGDALIIRSRS
jgi:hypothetical protein